MTADRTGLTDEILKRLDATYPPAGDPSRAAGAAAYMRNQFAFLGLTSPRMTALNREVLAGLAAPTEADLVAVAQACVSCHNSHNDSPRKDFKLKDVMGGVVIRIPIAD